MASPGQVDLIETMLRERGLTADDVPTDFLPQEGSPDEWERLDSDEASDLIDWLTDYGKS